MRIAGKLKYTETNSVAPVAATGTFVYTATGMTAGKVFNVGVRSDGSTAHVYTIVNALSAGPTVADEILKGADSDATMTNLKKAINNEVTEGTQYGVDTQRNLEIKATISTSGAGGTLTLTARVLGAAGNALAISTDEPQATASAATLAGGVDYVASVPAEIFVTGRPESDRIRAVKDYEMLANDIVILAQAAAGTRNEDTYSAAFKEATSGVDASEYTNV